MNNEWTECLGMMTYGIYVLTTSHEEDYNGMIASWITQISYDPPLVMAAIHPNRKSHQLIKKSGCFALHLITPEHKDLLSRFKGPNPKAKFKDIDWERGETGCPIIKESLSYMECIVRESLSPGNHTLYIGEVVDARVISDEIPMTTLDYNGIYIGKD